LIVYFETSALVKLLVEESGSDDAAHAWDSADSVTSSVITYTEARAALAAVHRGGRLSGEGLEIAKASLEHRWELIEAIAPSDEIVHHAAELAEIHALRGYDALHLATALASAPVLITFDADLARGSEAEGLHISSS